MTAGEHPDASQKGSGGRRSSTSESVLRGDAGANPAAACPDDDALDQERIDAAVHRIERVRARLVVLDLDAKQRGFAASLPTEQRLLQEALDLLNPEVKLA